MSYRPGYELVRPATPLAKGGPLSEEQIAQFFELGFVVVRGLVPEDLLLRVKRSEIEGGLRGGGYERVTTNLLQKCGTFADLALRSPVTQAVAQLTPYAGDRKLIAVGDAAFILKGAMQGCDFHVDDGLVWPCPADAPGPGINAWIPLDRVDEDGGGMALARGSNTATFLDCRAAVNQDQNGIERTCNIGTVAPELKKRLEDVVEVPRLELGDVILHTRYCFHRAEPFKKGSAAACGPGIARYSIRYMPGNAHVQTVEVQKDENGFRHVRGTPVSLSSADRVKYPLCEYNP